MIAGIDANTAVEITLGKSSTNRFRKEILEAAIHNGAFRLQLHKNQHTTHANGLYRLGSSAGVHRAGSTRSTSGEIKKKLTSAARPPAFFSSCVPKHLQCC
jgi:hypothetical protein